MLLFMKLLDTYGYIWTEIFGLGCNCIDIISVADNDTEFVAKHNTRLQLLISLHAPVTTFMFSCCSTEVLLQRKEGSGKPYAGIEPSIGTHCYQSMLKTHLFRLA